MGRLDIYTATGIAEGWIDCDDYETWQLAWQTLHDTGVAYSLQGFFGRQAQDLIAQGVIQS